MRIFGFLSIFLTKINTNSAKSCLLFRRKGVAGPPGRVQFDHSSGEESSGASVVSAVDGGSSA